MNLANKITIARIFLIPVIMVFIFVNVPSGKLIASIIFIIAALTDHLDGYVARKHNMVSNMGKLLDPLADKLLITAALISLVALDSISAWVAFIIISREFAVTGLRLVAAGEGKVLAASWWGKSKTIAQIVMVVALLLQEFTATFIPALPWQQLIIRFYPADELAAIALIAALLLTIVSGMHYFLVNKEIVSQ